MADVDSIKRRLLRELVQQNVDLKEGRLPRRLRRGNGLPLAARVALIVLLCTGLVGSSRLISMWSSAADPVSPAGRTASVTVPAAALAGTAKTGPARLEAPQAVVDSAVFPLAVRKVVIDPGHGGESLGTHTLGLIEKEVTLDIADRLRRLLEEQSFEVLMTRRADREVSLAERAHLANRGGADIFVSIHVNWIANPGSRGIETYYLGATNDPFLTQLAAAENRDSGYSLADVRSLLDRIYAGVRQDQSRKLAEVVQASLFSSLSKVNPQVQDRGVKAAPFIVLLSTEMPAILAEVSCLSNEEEARLLAKPLYRQFIAEALSQGVRSYADAVEGAGEKGI